MKRSFSLIAAFSGMAFMPTHTVHAQACAEMLTTVMATPDPYHTNTWDFGFSARNAISAGKKSIGITATVTDATGTHDVFMCFGVDDSKGEAQSFAGSVYSTTKPTFSWKTYTGGLNCGGTVCSQQALPIRYTSFSGVKNDKGVLLSWNAQIDNEHEPFIVQRSYDGVTFSSVGQVPQSELQHAYSYQDNPNSSGKEVFYRLSLNGKMSAIIAVWYTPGARAYLAGKTLWVQKPTMAQTCITSMNGVQFVTNSESISLVQYPSGIYLVTIYDTSGAVLYTNRIFL